MIIVSKRWFYVTCISSTFHYIARIQKKIPNWIDSCIRFVEMHRFRGQPWIINNSQQHWTLTKTEQIKLYIFFVDSNIAITKFECKKETKNYWLFTCICLIRRFLWKKKLINYFYFYVQTSWWINFPFLIAVNCFKIMNSSFNDNFMWNVNITFSVCS